MAVSTLESTVRRCSLMWGVRALRIEGFFENLDAAILGLRELLVEQGVLRPGDTFVLTSGVPFAHKVPTNSLTIAEA